MAGVSVTRPTRSTLITVPREVIHTRGRRGNWLPLWLLLPTILILLALQVYPAVYAVFLSLTKLRRGEAEFIGLDNYIRLFRSPSFIEGLQKTFIYAYWG
jgi:lactose/L-arabinose transport system permease protein